MPQNVQLQEGGSTVISAHPDHCPICHSKVAPVLRYGRSGTFRYKASVEMVYTCPNYECNEFFIAYYGVIDGQQGYMSLINARPIEPIALTFDDSIKQISPNFCGIYEEAHKAEEFGLTQICGVGYRKSLEFLIKDYLIVKRPDDKASIEAIMLGTCINNYVSDPRVKEVARRATWLGNDETHYQRRWMDKDLTDLKTMIKLVVHWIDAEHLTDEALKSMPAPAEP
jgi:hypothetical protein